jgi:hypothetical protein
VSLRPLGSIWPQKTVGTRVCPNDGITDPLVAVWPQPLAGSGPWQLRPLREGPRQILVAILGMAAAFAFAITEFRTAHTSAIAGPLAHRGKATNLADFVKGVRNLYLAFLGGMLWRKNLSGRFVSQSFHLLYDACYIYCALGSLLL